MTDVFLCAFFRTGKHSLCSVIFCDSAMSMNNGRFDICFASHHQNVFFLWPAVGGGMERKHETTVAMGAEMNIYACSAVKNFDSKNVWNRNASGFLLWYDIMT